jgi:hypothetical protein
MYTILCPFCGDRQDPDPCEICPACVVCEEPSDGSLVVISRDAAGVVTGDKALRHEAH